MTVLFGEPTVPRFSGNAGHTNRTQTDNIHTHNNNPKMQPNN